MIVSRWPAEFRRLYGGSWPTSYVTLDTETCGFSLKRDVVVEIGHCLVEDGVVTDRLNLVLDWSNHPVVPADYVKRRLEEVRRAMAADGRAYGMTWERMCAEGIRPEKALAFYHKLLATFASAGLPFALHNGFFDEEMLAHNFAGFGVDPAGFALPPVWFDTASIEKANQLAGDPDALPRPGETLRTYFRRLKYMSRGNVKCNLCEHCAVKYRFAEKYGVDMAQAHGAGFDAYLVHLLMQEFGGQGEAAPVSGPPRPSSPRPAAAEASYRRHKPLPGPTRRRGQRNR